MAERNPLVIISGAVQELPSGDTVAGAASTGVPALWTEVEIDFGTTPVTSKSFTLTDAAVTASSNVAVVQSAAPATGRGTDDALWDSITYAAKPAAGSFTLHAYATGAISGKRKIFYQVSGTGSGPGQTSLKAGVVGVMTTNVTLAAPAEIGGSAGRWLLTNQTTSYTENGVYDYVDGTTPLVRSSDLNTWDAILTYPIVPYYGDSELWVMGYANPAGAIDGTDGEQYWNAITIPAADPTPANLTSGRVQFEAYDDPFRFDYNFNEDVVASPLVVAGMTPWKYQVRSIAVNNISISAPDDDHFDDVNTGMTIYDYVLLVGQTDRSENGLWKFNGTGIALSRPGNADTWKKIWGAVVRVSEASRLYGGSIWALQDSEQRTVKTIGTDDQIWVPVNLAPKPNAIINGKFDVWQRGTGTFTSPGYTADQWYVDANGTTFNVDRVNIAPGGFPDHGKYAFEIGWSYSPGTSDFLVLEHRIENVRSFSGQKAAFSFWAYSAGNFGMSLEVEQYFGTGGSPSSVVRATYGDYPNTSPQYTENSWKKHVFFVDIPSIAGKTVGTNHDSYLCLRLWLDSGASLNSRSLGLGHQSDTFTFANMKFEPGWQVTDLPPEEPTVTLAKCQRYYQVAYSNTFLGVVDSATSATFAVQYATTMRENPIIGSLASLTNAINRINVGFSTPTAVDFGGSESKERGIIVATGASGMTAGQPALLGINIPLSAEL
jgi:hypothetical protein